MSQRRNLKPHAEARLAVCLFDQLYNEIEGGPMDLWDILTPGQKDQCRKIVQEIRMSRRWK